MSGLSIATKGKICIGGGVVCPTDWTSAEKAQIRDALGIDGAKSPSSGGIMQKIKSLIDFIFVLVS